ncbi:MAG: hypothetical protein A2166_02375 [Omnitrophica WOR_2 bacterium RBG_13_41_10]|nr:MAG: hypothetical protein A2166_02375 [Omnitrophica WOR_2 bacterium RBG_13_41_10]
MRNKNIDFFQKAQAYAFLLLKFRLRSENEIRQRLKIKKFEETLIDKTISFLKEKGFVDDRVFAKAWIDSRIKRPLGLKRLRQELKIKGVSEDIINEQILEAKKNYSEQVIVLDLAKERIKKLKRVEPKKAKQRIFGYLMRRGFSADTVIEALKEI